MIKLKGNILTVTGKDEKILKKYAKEVGMTPEKFLIEALKRMMEKYTTIDKDILLEKLQ